MDIKIKILAVMLVASGLVTIMGIQSSTNAGESTLDSVIPVGNSIDAADYSQMEHVSPIGAQVDEERDYRFSNKDGKILYGPYHVEGEKYYYYDGSVLDSQFSTTNKPEVKGLHNFYLKTYTDPLFYSPAENESAYNFSGINAAEKGKLLTQECDLEYDLVPEKYHNNLSENVERTEEFFEHASLENANELIQQNKQTTSSYSDMVGNYVDLLSKDLSDNKCFSEDAEYNGLNVQTPTPNQVKINDEVLINLFRMANQNSEKLTAEIDSRRTILSGENSNLESKEVSRSNQTTVRADYTPQEAMSEMNKRRIYEKTNVWTPSMTNQSRYGENLTMNQFESQNYSHEGYTYQSYVLIENGRNYSDREGFNYSQSDGEDINYAQSETESQEPDYVDNGENAGDENNYESFDAESIPQELRNKAKTVDSKPKAFDLESACVNSETVPVYGWDKNIYPNMISGKKLEFSASSYVGEDIAPNVFSSCNCPTGHTTRLSWYNVNQAYESVNNRRIHASYDGPSSDKVRDYENIFLADPGENTAENVGKTYKNALIESLNQSRYSSEIPHLWKRSIKQSSKLDNMKSVYDDFYNERHMDIWRSYFDLDEGEKVPRQQYNYFLTTESLYLLDIMPNSESVWRMDEKPAKTLTELN